VNSPWVDDTVMRNASEVCTLGHLGNHLKALSVIPQTAIHVGPERARMDVMLLYRPGALWERADFFSIVWFFSLSVWMQGWDRAQLLVKLARVSR